MTTPTLVTLPAPNLVWGHFQKLQEDLIAFQEEMASAGDFVKVRTLWLSLYYLNHPDLIRELLIKRAKVTKRQFTLKRATETFTPDDIFGGDGDFWKRQRKLMQPAFHSQRIGAYADDMVSLTQAAVANWTEGHVVDVNEFMSDVTMRIIVKTMFGADVDDDNNAIGETVEQLLNNASEDLVDPSLALPNWMPLKRVRRRKETLGRLAPLFQQFIDAWREKGEDTGDLLSMLMQSRYDDGSAMSDAQLMSEISVIFLAGHDTTAKTLTFAAIMLSQYPDIAAKLRAEVDAVLGDRAATLQDLPNLSYTTKVIKETMRLYPAAVGVGREVSEDMEIGGEAIKKGSQVMVNIWSVQRDARYYDDPLTFNPERWTEAFEAQLPRYAYIPFGAGPRVCLGNQFAMMEAQLVLATLAQHCDLSLLPGTSTEPEFNFTLRPASGTVPMQVSLRHPMPT